MPRTSYTVRHLPKTTTPAGSPYHDTYPVQLVDGSWLELPLQPLPGDEQGIALLMANQTSFAVEAALAPLLTELAKGFDPEVIVGVPTLGLDYARLVAQGLGFPHYVALGNSRKFWYDDHLAVPMHSATSPGMKKNLYLDPALVERTKGKRTLIIDDVINTGGSAVAAIELMQRAGADVVGLAVVLIEGEAWKPAVSAFGVDWPDRVRGLGKIPLFQKTAAGWVAI